MSLLQAYNLQMSIHSGILMKIQSKNLDESMEVGKYTVSGIFMTVKYQIDFMARLAYNY